jgi:hypothetical protein
MQPDANAMPAELPLHSDAQAARLVELCNRFHADLFDWLDRTLPQEPSEHAVPLKRAVSNVAFAMAERLLYPAYLERPALVPPPLRDDV